MMIRYSQMHRTDTLSQYSVFLGSNPFGVTYVETNNKNNKNSFINEHKHPANTVKTLEKYLKEFLNKRTQSSRTITYLTIM